MLHIRESDATQQRKWCCTAEKVVLHSRESGAAQQEKVVLHNRESLSGCYGFLFFIQSCHLCVMTRSGQVWLKWTGVGSRTCRGQTIVTVFKCMFTFSLHNALICLEVPFKKNYSSGTVM